MASDGFPYADNVPGNFAHEPPRPSFGYDREDLVSGVGEQLERQERLLEKAVALRLPDGNFHLVNAARSCIRPAMDAARAALDEAVLEQRAIAAKHIGFEQRRVALAKAALCRALKAMEGATVFVTSRERRKHPENTDIWLEDIEATRAAICILGDAGD